VTLSVETGQADGFGGMYATAGNGLIIAAELSQDWRSPFSGYIARAPAFEPGRDRFFAPAANAFRGDLGLVVNSGSLDLPDLRESALSIRVSERARAASLLP